MYEVNRSPRLGEGTRCTSGESCSGPREWRVSRKERPRHGRGKSKSNAIFKQHRCIGNRTWSARTGGSPRSPRKRDWLRNLILRHRPTKKIENIDALTRPRCLKNTTKRSSCMAQQTRVDGVETALDQKMSTLTHKLISVQIIRIYSIVGS